MLVRRIAVAIAAVGLFIAVGLFTNVAGAREPVPPVPGALTPECDRACLYGFMDRYLDALVHKEPSKLPWAPHARFTENNVERA